MINKIKFIWHILFSKSPGIVFFNLSDEQQKDIVERNAVDINIRYINVDIRAIEIIAKNLSGEDSQIED